mgnify:FL=1
MKRKDLTRLLEKNGWYIIREGHGHTIYTNGKDTEPVPRHTEVNEKLARRIIKHWGLK